MTTSSTRGSTVGFGLKLVALAGLITAGVAGCDQGTNPPPAAAAPPAGGPAAVPNSPGSSGPLGNMSSNPTSQLGRSAAMGKNTAQDALNRDAAAAGMAAEMSGEAQPVDVAGMRWSVPSSWERVRSTSTMRAAEFRIPDPQGGEGEATAIWFYFGPGQGGTVDENIARWSEMVRDEFGQAATPDVRRMKINGIPATVLAMEGTYRDGMPGQPQSIVDRPGYGFRAAIFEGPRGNVFIRLTGPAEVLNGMLTEWQQLFQSGRPDNM